MSEDLPNAWTPIAQRPRGVDVRLIWRALPHAVVSIEDAHALAAQGRITMANGHDENTVQLLIRPRSGPPPKARATVSAVPPQRNSKQRLG